MKKYLSIFLLVLLCCTALIDAVNAEELSQPALPPLVISELQTGGLRPDGTTDGKQEFIELYNTGETHLDVTGWKLEYLSAAHTGTGAPTRVLVELKGEIEPFGFVLLGPSGLLDADVAWAVPVSASGYLAQGGGHVRLVDSEGQAVDLVTWGNGAPIGSWATIADLRAGHSAQRILPFHPGFTGGQHFKVSAETSPEGGGLAVNLPPIPDCKLRLSEIMPNPAGADAGHEYIEVHNPHETAQSLADCSLRIGETALAVALPDQAVAPGGYAIIGDKVGFSLPNATAATVWLLGGAHQEGVKYADALYDNQVWWLRDGIWEMSKQGTPGAVNELQPGKTPPTVLAAVHLPDECPAGKERNPETNRCRTIPISPSLPAPCKPPQIRSPETGRCRTASTASASLAACKPGQERSEETNRCRTILPAAPATKPCPEGQVRNAMTNRCRKQDGAPLTLAKVEDVASGGQSKMRWGVVALAVAGLGGYALYEWRQDVLNALYRWRSKRPGRWPHWKFLRERGTIKNK